MSPRGPRDKRLDPKRNLNCQEILPKSRMRCRLKAVAQTDDPENLDRSIKLCAKHYKGLTGDAHTLLPALPKPPSQKEQAAIDTTKEARRWEKAEAEAGAILAEGAVWDGSATAHEVHQVAGWILSPPTFPMRAVISRIKKDTEQTFTIIQVKGDLVRLGTTDGGEHNGWRTGSGLKAKGYEALTESEARSIMSKAKSKSKTAAPKKERKINLGTMNAGTTYVRIYKGKEIEVKATAQGLEYKDHIYNSQTALAAEILGLAKRDPMPDGRPKQISGPAWFRPAVIKGSPEHKALLAPKPKAEPKPKKKAAAKKGSKAKS